MSFETTYRTLFEIKFRHHYFLDEGEDEFDEALNEEWMVNNLRAFDIREILTITPSEATMKNIRNGRGRYNLTKDTLTVLLRSDGSDPDKPFIDFLDNTNFDFTLGIKDAFFENYTEIDIDRSKLFFLSNKTPDTSVEDTAQTVVFSKFTQFGTSSSEIDIDISEDFSDMELVGKIGIIRVCFDGDVGEIDLTDGAGSFANTTPSVTVDFENRETLWRYIDTSDGSTIFTTTAKPLTKFGYIKITHSGTDYPNPNANLIIDESGTLYSEIFI